MTSIIEKCLSNACKFLKVNRNVLLIKICRFKRNNEYKTSKEGMRRGKHVRHHIQRRYVSLTPETTFISFNFEHKYITISKTADLFLAMVCYCLQHCDKCLNSVYAHTCPSYTVWFLGLQFSLLPQV